MPPRTVSLLPMKALHRIHDHDATNGYSLVFQAAIQQYRTVLKYPGNENVTDPRTGQVRDPANLYTWSIGGEYTSGTNILGLVFFAGDSRCTSDMHNILLTYC